MSPRTPFLIGAGILIAGSIFALGVAVGYTGQPATPPAVLSNTEPSAELAGEAIDFSPYWKVWNTIDTKFAPASTTEIAPTQERVWSSIQGLVSSLEDPYSVFLPPSDAQIFEENIQGNFGGVGMEIGIRDDVLTVIAPLKGTPAERAGLQSGDQILAVDEEPTSQMTVDEAVKRIRGEIGTDIVLTVGREGKQEPFDVTITRANISIPTIDTEVRKTASAPTGSSEDETTVPEDVFVISLYNFSAQSPNRFRASLRAFVESDARKLILDLRGNAGGFLHASVDIASWFLPAGKVIVTEDFSNGDEDIVYRSKGYDIFNDNLEMVVLVNRGSASASEILAGALSEHGIATLVGEPTFGKGSVQELIQITPEASLKLTVAHWLTPEGNLISEGGIAPDVEVSVSPEDAEAGRDPQLEKAIEIVSGQ